jgi:hypothetical protein
MAKHPTEGDVDANSFVDEKPAQNFSQIEDVGANRASAKYYTATTPEEKALDKALNRKLDSIVVVLLAINFLVHLS